MAPSFLGLPTEIRLEIYGYLFQSIEAELDIVQNGGQPGQSPQDHNGPAPFRYTVENSNAVFVRTKALSNNTAVLQTCQHVYNEALKTLYVQTCFLYVPLELRYMNAPIPRTLNFAPHRLAMVQKLGFAVEERNLHNHPSDIVCMLEYFSSVGCSLKQLSLDFHSHSIPMFRPPAAFGAFFKDTSVAKALSRFHISEEIWVTLAGPRIRGGRDFERFVRTIATAIGWACYLEVKDSRGMQDRSAFLDQQERDVNLCGHLRPTGAATPLKATHYMVLASDSRSEYDPNNITWLEISPPTIPSPIGQSMSAAAEF